MKFVTSDLGIVVYFCSVSAFSFFIGLYFWINIFPCLSAVAVLGWTYFNFSILGSSFSPIYSVYLNWLSFVVSLIAHIFCYYLDCIQLFCVMLYFMVRYIFVILLFYFVAVSAAFMYVIIEWTDIMLDAGFPLMGSSSRNFNGATGFGIEPVFTLNVTPKGVSGEDLVPLGFISSIHVLIMWAIYFSSTCFWFALVGVSNLFSAFIWNCFNGVMLFTVANSVAAKSLASYFMYSAYYGLASKFFIVSLSGGIIFFIFACMFLPFKASHRIQFFMFKFLKVNLFSFFIKSKVFSQLKLHSTKSDFYFLLKSVLAMSSQYVFSQPWRFETYVVFLSEIRIDPKVINFYVW